MSTGTALILGAVLILAMFVTVFYLGGEWRVKHYWMPASMGARQDTVTPARFQPSAPITGVIALPPIQVVTASIDIVRSPEIVRENDTLSRDMVLALARIAELEDALGAEKAKTVRLEHLRARHWKSAKVARARLTAVIGATFEAPRRPTKFAMLAEVIDLSTAREQLRVHVIPPLKASEWRTA